MVAFSGELQVVDEGEGAVVDAEHVAAGLEEVVALVSGYVDYFFNAVGGARVDDGGDAVLVGYF